MTDPLGENSRNPTKKPEKSELKPSQIKFDSRLTFEDLCAWYCLSYLGELASLWTALCCFVATMHLFSKSSSVVLWCGSAAECHLQLLERQVYSVARLCHDQIFLLCHRRHVAALCMLYNVISNSNHCLLSELPSASVRGRQTRAAAAANPLV